MALFISRAEKCPNGFVGTLCAGWHSPWTVSCYFLLFLIMVAVVLVNILLSFFLDIYSFVWQEYTKGFEVKARSKADQACERVVHGLNDLWERKLKREKRLETSSFHKAMGMVGVDAIYERRIGQQNNIFGSLLASSMKCSSCLLCEPYVDNINYRFSPLFVPANGMFSNINGYDTVVMCEACSVYWKGMEMLTCDRVRVHPHSSQQQQRSYVPIFDPNVSVGCWLSRALCTSKRQPTSRLARPWLKMVRLMSCLRHGRLLRLIDTQCIRNALLLPTSVATDICNDQANMQMKIRIMLKLYMKDPSSDRYGVPAVSLHHIAANGR